MAYVGFEKLKGQLAARGDVRNPGALAASIGRKKYGTSTFQRAAARGTSLKGMAPSLRALHHPS
jgi:hypothetical protein